MSQYLSYTTHPIPTKEPERNSRLRLVALPVSMVSGTEIPFDFGAHYPSKSCCTTPLTVCIGGEPRCSSAPIINCLTIVPLFAKSARIHPSRLETRLSQRAAPSENGQPAAETSFLALYPIGLFPFLLSFRAQREIPFTTNSCVSFSGKRTRSLHSIIGSCD
jgi:hypothetical protein